MVIMLASQAEDTGSIPAYRFIFYSTQSNRACVLALKYRINSSFSDISLSLNVEFLLYSLS